MPDKETTASPPEKKVVAERADAGTADQPPAAAEAQVEQTKAEGGGVTVVETSDGPQELVPNVSVEPDEPVSHQHPLVAPASQNNVDDAQLALNQAQMVEPTGDEAEKEGRTILLASSWQTSTFKSSDGSFPDILCTGTWVTPDEAVKAEHAAHHCHEQLFRLEER